MFTGASLRTAGRLARATAAALVLVAIGSAGNLTVEASARPPAETVDVTILTPKDGLPVNAAVLEIQALVAARRAGGDDAWTGVLRVDLAIDGVNTQTLDPTVCRGSMAAGFRASLTDLAPGPHVATVTARKKSRGGTVQGAASFTFVIDPSLPVRETNRIEEAATPAPFACLSTPDFDADDDNRSDDFDARFATLRGSFVPNALSAGLDLRSDRVVLALDGQVVVIEPGAFVCKARNRCRFTDKTSPLVRSVRLEQKRNGRWTFTIATRQRPWAVRALFLRIGANWGGLDVARDRYVAALEPALDGASRATATIGSGGGMLQTTDAAGVIITLTVPPGALTAETALTMTPLAASPLVSAAGAIHPGVSLEPDGLQFAEAATLAFDFSQTATAITDQQSIHLLTSPMTKVPLYGTAEMASRVLTAEIHHFSTYDPSAPTAAFEDLKAWADPILTAGGQPTFAELEALVALARDQMALGCTANCIDLAAVAATLSDDIAALVTAACSADAASPTDLILERWLKLDALGQGMGADTTPIRPCLRSILRQLIVDAGPAASANPSAATFMRLALPLRNRADALGFTDLSRLALVQLDAALRALIAQASAVCPVDPVAGKAQLNSGLLWTSFVDLDPTIDPSLTRDLLAAIENCRAASAGGTLTATVLAGSVAGASDNHFNYTEGDVWWQRTVLGADTVGPQTLSASFGGASISVVITQPSPNVIAIDATIANAGRPPDMYGASDMHAWALILLNLTPSGPGTVSTVDNFANWRTSGTCQGNILGPSGLFGSGDCQGSGRLLTITFTPQ